MRYVALFIIVSFFISCSNSEKKIGDINIMDQSVKNDLQTLEKAKIFFGHQSVGFNLIDGMADLMKEAGNNNIKIIEADGTTELPEYFFAHARAGKNTEPNTKCDAFAKFLTDDFANKLDIAFLKFCYVDMLTNDDPNAVFEYYKSVMNNIKEKYPDLTIMHLTIPLTAIQSGWKATVKKMIGREIDGYKENIKRYEYNELLKKTYKNDPIFDLSTVESTYPDGSRQSFEMDGHTYYAMVPAYTYDGGHLNELGRQIAAKEMIHVLAEIVRNKNKQ